MLTSCIVLVRDHTLVYQRRISYLLPRSILEGDTTDSIARQQFFLRELEPFNARLAKEKLTNELGVA
jgi:hypothetical protein